MSLPPAFESLIRENLTVLITALLLLAAVLVVLVVVLASRLGRMTRLYRKLTTGTSGGNLEEHLVGYVEQVRNVDERMKALEERAGQLADTQRRCLQHVGVVRYDAFEDVGGEQSFSLALTDSEKNGAVMSSVYSRTDVRVYAKALSNGKASHPLSAEEQRALAAAMDSLERQAVREGA